MRFVDVILHKRDGLALTREEIAAFVRGVTDGTVPDYQASALLMAIVLRGMTALETSWLTDAMVGSGERMDLSDIPGTKVGKHSTGGVGDKVTIALAPLAACCGVVVPKMSGRGLGHTGGTVDKVQAIPGFRVDLSIAEFKAVLRDVGTAVIGQTMALAPADKKLYALRDVTGTVESFPLVASSIMSKKLAEGTDALVLDVKCGDGAFMKDEAGARALAEAMVAIGTKAGVRTEAVITAMEAPLGRAIGNANEVAECIETLKGRGPADLTEAVRHLAGRMLVLGGVAHDGEAAAAVEDALASGRALERLARMIERQGGDPRVVDEPSRLPAAPHHELVRAWRPGFVTAIRASALGRASNLLGAGRTKVDDAIDHGVGLTVRARHGEPVVEGQPLLELHHRGGRGLPDALALCRAAIAIGDEAPPARPTLLGEVR